MKNFEITSHVYAFTCILNGKTNKGIVPDSCIIDLMTKVYNTNDKSEINIRNSLRALMNGFTKKVIIDDTKDGGHIIIELIK